MKAQLRKYLLRLQSVSDITTKIYSAPAPEGETNPMILLSRVSGDSTHTNAGILGRSEELWQIDCYADTGDQCEELKEAVRTGLDAYTGFMDDIEVFSTTLERIDDLSFIEGDGSENSEHRKELEFRIIHSEALADYVTTTTTTTTTTTI